MEYINLGNSDLKVSRICLGCMGFGKPEEGMHKWTLDQEKTNEIIKHALDSGINFFDTAMGYQNGTSEEFVGNALKQYAKREDVVLATKFVPISKEEIEKGITTQQHIENCVDASLKRLQMDYIDLYIYHIWDFNSKIEDIMEGLHNLIQKGKIRYIGISNCYAYQLAMCNEIAKNHGWETFISIQGHYNLLFREEEREMARYCKENNVSMTPYSSLASGRLSKKPGETSKRLELDAFAKSKYDATKDADEIIIERVLEIANKRNVSMTEVSLAWLLTKVASPVVGATKFHHIDGAIKGVDLKLTEEEIQYLEECYVPHKIVGVMAGY